MMEWVRAIVRPAITLSGWGLIVALIARGQPVPEPFWALVGTLTAWWFADRRQEGNGPGHGV